MRYLMIISLFLTGCLPCLATPDCLTEHKVQVRMADGQSPSSFQVESMNSFGAETWQCPSEDTRCEDNGVVKLYIDGVITITLMDGQSIMQEIKSGPTESCGCSENTDVRLQFE